MNELQLKECPCGKIPTALCLSGEGSKYATACGNCCSDWNIEFRCSYADGEEAYTLATNAWNQATRKGDRDAS